MTYRNHDHEARIVERWHLNGNLIGFGDLDDDNILNMQDVISDAYEDLTMEIMSGDPRI